MKSALRSLPLLSEKEIRQIVCAEKIGEDTAFKKVDLKVKDGIALRARDWALLGNEYFEFSKKFPEILDALVKRLEEEGSLVETKEHLTEIYNEEMGKSTRGNSIAHHQMFLNFLNAMTGEFKPTKIRNSETHNLLSGLMEIYKQKPLEYALGAQTAFEIIGEEIIKAISPIAFASAELLGM
jgi:hypothetical protein